MNMTAALEKIWIAGRSGLGAPIMVMLLLTMLILPLPAFFLDLLFTFNITLSLIVLLVVVYSARPMDFAIFPTVILVATLLRLALNVASTRVVLMYGHNGGDAAGKVIEAFGEFVVGGNFAVGLVVFSILVIINFVVVTKGAGRVSEVSARFTLDAMPGKQMAIDADLNSGFITQDEARQRREDITGEADFYGSMDGASKFVRGDAIAGILILFINIVGGLIIGVSQHDLSFADASHNYVLLTIGDGLVAQIPALLLSTASAIIVTRVSSSSMDMGEQFSSQLLENPRPLAISAGAVGIMGLIPGMPNLPFLILASGLAVGAYFVSKRNASLELYDAEPQMPEPPGENIELSWDDVMPVDMIGLEVGYRLIPLVDKSQGGQLMSRIKGVRKKLSQEFGFLVPSVHIRDNLDLAPNSYAISLMGVTVGEAEVHPDREMAINPGRVFGTLQGIQGIDPAFGLEATWITRDQKDQAQTLGYTVVDPGTVIATHMSHVIQNHVHELFGHEEAQHLLDTLAKTAPKLVEGLIPKLLPLGTFVKVIQNLLREQIPVRDIRTIAETLAEYALRSQDTGALTAAVRVALGRLIVQKIKGMDGEMQVITLAPELEQLLHQTLETAGDSVAGIEPGLAEQMQKSIQESSRQLETEGHPPIMLVSPVIREWISRFARHSGAGINVLAYNEIPDDRQIKVVATVGQHAA